MRANVTAYARDLPDLDDQEFFGTERNVAGPRQSVYAQPTTCAQTTITSHTHKIALEFVRMHLQGLNYLQTVIVVRDKPLLSHNNSNQMKNRRFVFATFSDAPSH